MSMTKKERCMAAVNGQRPDQLPYSLWSHKPGIDLDPVASAEKTYEFYKTYDVDFIKTMNNGMYAIEDFGCEVDYSEIAKGGVAKVTKNPINSPEDWLQIKVCSCTEGALARELKYLDLLMEHLGEDDVPVLFTVFSPVTIANKLCGGKLMQFIREGHGDKIHAALKVITETTAKLAAECIRHGAAGIFFASQMSTYGSMTAEEYLTYGKPYDLQVLEAAGEGWMNTIHCHGNDIMFEVLKDYPVDVFNWHAWETLPGLEEAFRLTGKCLMGGLNRNDITTCNKNAIQNQIFNCFKEMDGMHQILTPGCVIRYPLDDDMLAFVKKTKDAVEACFV